jgi:hypothetical protein
MLKWLPSIDSFWSLATLDKTPDLHGLLICLLAHAFARLNVHPFKDQLKPLLFLPQGSGHMSQQPVSGECAGNSQLHPGFSLGPK